MASTSDSVTRDVRPVGPNQPITVSAIERRKFDTHLIGQNFNIRRTTGAAVNAAESGCWTA